MSKHTYPDAPCAICGEVCHPYAKGMCKPCYTRHRHAEQCRKQGLPEPKSRSLLGVVRNGWERMGCEHGVRRYKCVQCGAALTRESSTWPGPHKCTYKFAPQNAAQRAVVDLFIRSRYGLDMTCVDMAQAFGASPVYIREILYKAREAAETEADDD